MSLVDIEYSFRKIGNRPYTPPIGTRRRIAKQRAERGEAERQQKLIQDIGGASSAIQRTAIEVISAQVVRARRMRAAGRHSEAEMAERLAMRGLGQLGIRSAKTTPQGAGAWNALLGEVARGNEPA